VSGPGGAGKTRFALELAGRAREERFSDYPDGVLACFLAPLRDPALVLPTIAQTLSTAEVPGQSALETLSAHLGSKRVLLLLDNLEHVLASAPEVSQLLERCSGLTLLVTSRELLRIPGELAYDLPELADDEGVALFCERAAVEPSQVIGEVCRRLDGLPLAIELAAARMRLLSPEQLLERLGSRLDLLKGSRDADPRQKTLRATIEWSYELLGPVEQQLFARLSVFAGGCTLEAAEEICEADVDSLESLLDKSLLRRMDTGSGPRLWMLETIREYAADRLAARGESPEVRQRHASHFAYRVLPDPLVLRGGDPGAFQAVRAEEDNLRAALALGSEHGDCLLLGRMLLPMAVYWIVAGAGEEGRMWAVRYLESDRERVSPVDRFTGDLGASEIFRFTGDGATAARLKLECLSTCRASPDASVAGRALDAWAPALLSDLSHMSREAGQIDGARAYAEEALAIRRERGEPGGIAHALGAAAAIEYGERCFELARDMYVEACECYRRSDDRRLDGAGVLLELACCHVHLGELDHAEVNLREAVVALGETHDLGNRVFALRCAAMLAHERGEPARCVTLFALADRLLRDSSVVVFAGNEDCIHREYLERAENVLGPAGAADARAEAGAMEDDSWRRAVLECVGEAPGASV
jgi:predicted ATPase